MYQQQQAACGEPCGEPGYVVGPPVYHVPPPMYHLQPPPAVVYQTVGNCPACHCGILQSEVSVLGIICCILLFPIGLLCLLLMQDQRCPSCGYTTS